MAKKTKSVKKINSTEDLLQQTNELLKKQLILQLATLGTPHQTIRKIVGGEMKYVTRLLKPLKETINKDGKDKKEGKKSSGKVRQRKT